MPMFDPMPLLTLTFRSTLRAVLVAICLATGAEGIGAQDARPLLRQPDPIADYLAAIDQAEANDSAYAEELADLYLGLGGELVRASKFEEARDAYHKGAQVARVNFGLDAPEQVNYLLAIADLDVREESWEDADKLMRSAFRINAEGNTGEARAQIAAMEHLIDWYEERYPTMPPLEQYRAVLRAEQITQQMAGIAERELGLGNPQTTNLHRRQGRLNYFLAKLLTGSPYIMSTTTASPIFRWDGQRVSINTHYLMGEQALRKVAESLAANPDSSPVEHAEALAQLGDWHLLFGKNRTAQKAYGVAWQALADGAQVDSAQVYFGSPTPLRLLVQTPLKPGAQDAMPAEGLKVSMTVTKTGSTTSLVFLDSVDHLSRQQVYRIKRKLTGLLFRPRVHQGEVVDTRDFPWRYALTSDREPA